MTTVPLTLEQSLEISEFCSSILSTDQSIIFVAAVNKKGRMIDIKLHDERERLELSEKELEILNMQSMLQITMLRDFDKKFGISKFLHIEREHLSEFVFPFFEGILIILCGSDMVPSFMKRVDGMINEFVLFCESKTLK